MNSGNQDLIQVQNSVSAMEKIETGLAQMRDRFIGRTYDVTTTPGMTLAKADRAEVREVRFEVERARKAGKAPLLALGKWADQTAARITAEIFKIEAPIDTVVKAEEARVEAEKQARIDAEILRVQLIQERLAELRGAPAACAASHSDVILGHIADIEAKIIDSSFAEFEQEASKAKTATLASLRGLHVAAVARELEDQRIAAERAELATLRAAQEDRDRADKAKRDEEERIASETRKAEAKADEDNRQRNAMALQEIQAIHHQLMIADTGRSPYIKGGTVEGHDKLIEQTEAWEITEEKFGALTASAQNAKDTVLAGLRQKRVDLISRIEFEREQEKVRAASVRPPARKRAHNPGSEAICEVVANFYSVEKYMAQSWLREIDWETAPA